MKKSSPKITLILLSFLLVFSCKEDLVDPLAVKSSQLTGALPPQIFDWETVDVVPTGNDVVINMPWAGSNGLFDPQITFDFKKADGWKMIFNTFRTDAVFQNGAYFALYNKYRGVLRFYFYIKPNNFIGSNYLEENFILASGNGTISSFWNFANKEVIDPGVISTESRSIKNFPVPSDGGWYVSEYDIAYDPNLKNRSYSDIWLLNDLRFWSVTQTNLSGQITGTSIPVSVRTNPGFDVTSLLDANRIIGVAGILSTLQRPLNSDGSSGSSTLDKEFLKEVDKIKINGATAIIKSVSNIILTGNPLSGSTQTHYKINLGASFTGTNTYSGSIKENFKIALPGTSNATSGIGPVPVDNEPLGIFNLNSRPLVHVRNSRINTIPQCLAPGGVGMNPYEYTFYLDNDFLKSLNPGYNPNVYNPKFLEIARVTQAYSYYWGTWGVPGPKVEILVGTYNSAIPNGVTIAGKTNCTFIPHEIISGLSMVNITPSTNGPNGGGGIVGNGIFNTSTPVYLRITFDVTPRDGSPKTTIVKTFKCNVSSWL